MDIGPTSTLSHSPAFSISLSHERYLQILSGTSLAVVPSGRHMVAGFTDGTLRLFDLTGCFRSQDDISSDNTKHANDYEDVNLFDSDSSDDENPFESDDDSDAVVKKSKSRLPSAASAYSSSFAPIGGGGGGILVCSKSHQRYGAVVCQIHAKGVHTSLQMTVAVSPDGLYAFGGVARGSMELVAVDLSAVEQHVDANCTMTTTTNERVDLLDLTHVHRHADAKLRGFGACTRLHGKDTWSAEGESEPTYILLTGKGIKNIHIWSFQPRRELWQCLYDTQSNGSSISILHLRYSPSGELHAVSKSDSSQKLRIWDLTHEQQAQLNADGNGGTRQRPKRPPYKDLSGTESTLGIGGDFAFGGCLYEQISLVNLNAEPPYNVSELLLPGRSGASDRPRGARQQRGEMQALQQVAGMAMDGSHVLLEMSDFSVVHFHVEGSVPRLKTLLDGGSESDSRTICVARIGSSGITVAAMAAGRRIKLLQIGDKSSEGYWGFHGVAMSRPGMSSPCADSEAIALAAGSSAVNLFAKRNSGYRRSSYASSIASEEGSITSSETPISAISTAAPTMELQTPFADAKLATNMIPPSAGTAASSSAVPASATKALGAHPSVTKPTRFSSVAVSPECASQESSEKRKMKKKSATSTNETKEGPSERKKLVLHLRIPRASETGVDKSHSEHVTNPTKSRSISSVEITNTNSRKKSILKKELPLDGATKAPDVQLPTKHERTSNSVQNQTVFRPTKSAVGNSMNIIPQAIPKKKSIRPRIIPSPQIKRSEGATNPTKTPQKCNPENSMNTKAIAYPNKESKPLDVVISPQLTRPNPEPRKKNSEIIAAVALATLHSAGSELTVRKDASRPECEEQNSGLSIEATSVREKSVSASPDSSMTSETAKNTGDTRSKRSLGKDQGTTDLLVLADSHFDCIPASASKSPRRIATKKIGVPLKRPASATVTPVATKSRRVVDENLGDLDSVNVGLPLYWQRPSQRFGSTEKAPENELRRINLALEHRAAHEMLRNQVLEAVPQLLRSMWSQEGTSAINDIKNALEDVINDYTETLVSACDQSERFASSLSRIADSALCRTIYFSGRRWKRQLSQQPCSCRTPLQCLFHFLKYLTRQEGHCP